MVPAEVSAACRESPERVAHEVSDVLDFGALVVVRENDRVALAREFADLGGQRGDVHHSASAGGVTAQLSMRWVVPTRPDTKARAGRSRRSSGSSVCGSTRTA